MSSAGANYEVRLGINISQFVSGLQQAGGTVQQMTARFNAQNGALTGLTGKMKMQTAETQKAVKTQKEFAGTTINSSAALKVLQSSGQGTMLGMSILNKNIMGVAMSTVFLKYSMLPVVAATAALTVALGALNTMMTSVVSTGTTMAQSWEALGQQVANYTQSAKEANAVLAQADQLSQQYGQSKTQIAQMLTLLDRFNLKSKDYYMAIMNTASATGQSTKTVSDRFTQILMSQADQRQQLIRQFAIDYNLPIKYYATSLQLATAMNDRFANSAANSASTTAGGIARLSEAWDSFRIRVGTMIDEIIKPFFEPLAAFIQAAINGFDKAMEAAKVSGELGRSLEDVNFAAKRLIPFMTQLGDLFGKTMVKALIWLAQNIKVAIDTMYTFWRRIKPVIDTIMQWIHAIKEVIDWIIEWYKHHTALGNKIVEVWLAMILFNKALEIFAGLISPLVKLVDGLTAAITRLGQGWKQLQVLIDTVKALGTALGNLKDAALKVAVNVAGNAWDMLKALLDEIGMIPNFIVTQVDALTDKAQEGLKKVKQMLDDLKDKTINVVANIKSKGNIPGLGGYGVTGITLPLQLIPLIPVPVLIAAGAIIVTVLTAAMVAKFPTQTGEVVGAIGAMFLAFPVLLGATIVLVAATLVNFFATALRISLMAQFDILKTSVEIGINIMLYPLYGIGTIIANIFKDLAHGDVLGALGQFIQLLVFPFTMVPGMIASAVSPVKDLLTGDVPKWFFGVKDAAANALGDLGVLGVVGTFVTGIEKLWGTEWWDKFTTGISKGWNEANKITGGALDDMWQNIRKQFGDWDSNYGLLGLFGWAFRAIKGGIERLNIFGPVLDGLYNIVNFFRQYGGEVIDWLHKLGDNPIGDLLGRLSGHALGGVVPGPVGSPQLIIAHGGEQFLGAPTIADARPQSNGGGGGDVYISVSVGNSVITNENAMRDLAAQVSDQIVNSMGLGRKLTFHRVG